MRRGIFGSRRSGALARLGLVVIAACGGSTPMTGVDSGGGGSDGGAIDGPIAIDGGTATPGPGGPWTAMTLLDDPGTTRPVPHRGRMGDRACPGLSQRDSRMKSMSPRTKIASSARIGPHAGNVSGRRSMPRKPAGASRAPSPP